MRGEGSIYKKEEVQGRVEYLISLKIRDMLSLCIDMASYLRRHLLRTCNRKLFPH